MPERLGVVAGSGLAAPDGLRRLALDDLAGLLGDLLGSDRGAGRGERYPGGPARFLPEAGAGGRRLTEGSSEGGGPEELMESPPIRCSSSAIRRSMRSNAAAGAACTFGGVCPQRGSGSGGVAPISRLV